MKAREVTKMPSFDLAFAYAHLHALGGALRLPTNGRRNELRFERDAVVDRLRAPTDRRTQRSPARSGGVPPAARG